MSDITLEEYEAKRRRHNLAEGNVLLFTCSRDSFPLDRNLYDEWGTRGTIASTVRELAERVWGDYCIRHRVEWPFYRVELLDGTSLDLDQPIGNDVGDLLSNGIREVKVIFRRVESTA